MNSPELPLMHGTDWSGQSLAGWWLSEKLDGWRCLWTGREFLTRRGHVPHAPAWFLAGMPALPLDGELWAGRGAFGTIQRNALSQAGDWRGILFCPFDVPASGTRIEDALATLRALRLPSHVRPVEYRRCASSAEAIAILRSLQAQGGEGAMLRRPGSRYQPGRTSDLLKIKGELA